MATEKRLTVAPGNRSFLRGAACVAILLAVSLCVAAHGQQAKEGFRSEIVLKCPSGGGAGEFTYSREDGASCPGPMCFAVDGKRCVYIPDFSPFGDTTILRFAAGGSFTVALGVLATSGGALMAVSGTGELYLLDLRKCGGGYGTVINKYSAEGEFLHCLTRNGITPPETIESLDRADGPDAWCFGYITFMTVSAEGDLFVQEGNGNGIPPPIVYRFNTSGELLEKGPGIHPEVVQLMRQQRDMDARLDRLLIGQGKLHAVYSVKAPDGYWYYMTYDSKMLEIHRVLAGLQEDLETSESAAEKR